MTCAVAARCADRILLYADCGRQSGGSATDPEFVWRSKSNSRMGMGMTENKAAAALRASTTRAELEGADGQGQR